MTDIEIQKQFELWNSAILSRDSQKVTALYDENAILLPTISNKVRHNHSEIEDYFRQFLSKGPKGEVDESNPRLFGDVAINSGLYQFSFENGDIVKARFTFVYRRVQDSWKIVEHHSSVMPE
tara:strand:- start:238 stop:603 length:366 start_codon:yes stop_codon:yes gene_type:complete